jgi:preprotein translocase subunit YajC
VAAHLPPQQETAKIEVGATVEVLETFKSNSKGDKATLKPGQTGTVVKLDDDGDAFIKFDAHKDKEWVVRANFHKLRIIESWRSAKDHSEEALEVPDTQNRRTRGAALQPTATFSPQGPPQQLAFPVQAPAPIVSQGPITVAPPQYVERASAPPLVKPFQASPVQTQIESRMTALQAQAAAIDNHHAMIEAEFRKVASMQQQVMHSRTKVIEEIQALHGEIEKQKAVGGQLGARGYGIDTLSQTSTSAGPPSLMDEFENMKEGATVTVLEDFMSNSKGAKVQLKVGQKGVVSRVDGDGDVLVKFQDHPDKEWITRNNFDKLRVSKAAKVSKADGPKVTEVSNSGSVCTC